MLYYIVANKERRICMRLKHVKGASEKIENSSYVVHNYEENKGNWKNLFGNNNPIYIEIGMGKGKFLIENATKYPNINFIGIEKFDSVMVRAVEKLENSDLNNIKLIRMDATKIDEVFSKEIEQIYLNFSDPWPKKRHENRRLTSKVFLDKYSNIFKDKFNIIQKTDNRSLFEFSLISFNNEGYQFKELSLDLTLDDVPDNIETEYESKFRKQGKPIYRVFVQK